MILLTGQKPVFRGALKIICIMKKTLGIIIVIMLASTLFINAKSMDNAEFGLDEAWVPCQDQEDPGGPFRKRLCETCEWEDTYTGNTGTCKVPDP